MDEILLEGMLFYGYHGVNPEEQALGQRFIVDLTVTADLDAAARTDDLTTTISYSEIFKRVRPIGDFSQWKDTAHYEKAFQQLLKVLRAA